MNRLLASLCTLVMLASAASSRAEPPIVLCGHVAITGAAPIPHNRARFGQFYFDYVNAELGGVNGKPVRMDVIDDQFNPVGAREAISQCAQEQPDLYFGFSGDGEIATVANWAEANRVPYLHGAASAGDRSGLSWSAFLEPTNEESQTTLADVIAGNTATLSGPAAPVIGVLRYDAPYSTSAFNAFSRELEKHGLSVATDDQAGARTTDYTAIWLDFLRHGVNIINSDVGATTQIEFMNQRPSGYNPTFTTAYPEAASNIVAQAAGNYGITNYFALHDSAPSCNCTYFTTDLDTSLPYASEMSEFLRIFKQYSPEENPPPDDYDWMYYLRAKQLHRFLLSLNRDYAPDHVRAAFSSFSESSSDAFPSCALDFASTPMQGQHAWDAFELSGKEWKEAATCARTSGGIDISPPSVSCDTAAVVHGREACTATDSVSGVGAWSVSSTGIPAGTLATGDGYCAQVATMAFDVPQGAHDIDVTATDCAGHSATAKILVASY